VPILVASLRLRYSTLANVKSLGITKFETADLRKGGINLAVKNGKKATNPKKLVKKVTGPLVVLAPCSLRALLVFLAVGSHG
jgi:hypothetical protein